MTSFFRGLDKGVQRALYFICITVFITLATILLTNVYMRIANDFSIKLDIGGYASAARVVKALVPMTSMHWLDEIVELCFAYLVFYGAAALWGVKGHFCVGDWISARLPGVRSRALYKLFVSLLSLLFVFVFFWYSMNLTGKATELSTVFQIPKSVMYSCMPISSLIMMVYSLADVYLDVKQLFAPDESGGSAERVSQSM